MKILQPVILMKRIRFHIRCCSMFKSFYEKISARNIYRIIFLSLLFCVHSVESFSQSYVDIDETCEKCKGHGTIVCKKCNETGFIKCKKCKGNGFKKKKDTVIPCSNCDGIGFFTCPDCDGEKLQVCKNCHGVGNYVVRECLKCFAGSIKCNFCGGKGYSGYRTEVTKCRECGGTTRMKCPSCNGNPKGPVSCKTCNNTGYVKCTICKQGSVKRQIKVDCHRCNGKGADLCPYCHGAFRKKIYLN